MAYSSVDRALLLTVALTVILLSCGVITHAKGAETEGEISGVVLDQTTGASLSGATVRLLGTDQAKASDESGEFLFLQVPAGTYRLTVEFLGYRDRIIEGVLIAGDNTVEVRVEMTATPVAGQSVVVRGTRDPQSDRAGTGTVVVTGETISERPGSLNDISRAVSAMVPVARFDDRYPSLIVRGGSAIENGFYIDNIPIPTINHFPSQGAGSGPLGLLNAHLIESARFYAGGFPVAYGDRLSSIFAIDLREGNRREFSGVGILDVTGASAILNGPLPNGWGSYFISGRQGFLNLLMDMVNIDASPNYADLHAKVTSDLDTLTELSALALVGRGDFYLSEEVSNNGGADFYGQMDYRSATVGINLDRRRPESGRSQTSLSASSIHRNDDHYFTESQNRVFDNTSIDESITLRHDATQRLGSLFTAYYGAEGQFRNADYHFLINPFSDEGGYLSDTVLVNTVERYMDFGLWLAGEWRLGRFVTVRTGARFDRWGFAEHEQVSPRGSIHIRASEHTSFYTAAGLYCQSLPLSLLLQQPENRDLEELRALHVVVGLSRRVTENFRANFEAYTKKYDNIPMDSTRPTVFVLDELVYDYGFLPGHPPLESSGEATVRGGEASVDLTVRNRLLIGISGSLMRAQYDDYSGVRRNRVIDNQLAFDVETRYRPAKGWQINARWVYGGGRPYTPYHLDSTRQLNMVIFDLARANEVRFPAYHSLNLRMQREFVFEGSRLVVYGEVWNAYNRDNIAGQYWDSDEQTVQTVHQFPRLPVLGIEYRF